MRHQGRCLTCILLFMLIFLHVPAWTKEPAPILEWSEIENAISSHPDFRSSQAEVAIAEGEVRLTKQYPNPDFGARLGASHPKAGPGREFVWDLELTIPVEWPGAYLYRKQSAAFGVEASKFEAEAIRLEVWRELRTLYLTAAFDQYKLLLMRKTETELIRLVEAARVRVDKGEARPVELNRAQCELEEHRIALNTAESEARAHRRRLSLWLGGKPSDQFSVVADLEALDTIPNLDEVIQSSLSRHPAIKAANARGKQAESSATAERHAVVPGIQAGGFYGQELDSTSYGGLITISLPLWNWNRGGVSKADAEKRRALAHVDSKKREIMDCIIDAHAKAYAAFDAVRRYRDGVLPESEKMYQDMEQRYRNGEEGLMDVLDARRAHLRTQDAYQTELFNYHLAMLNLNVWMGGVPNV